MVLGHPGDPAVGADATFQAAKAAARSIAAQLSAVLGAPQLDFAALHNVATVGVEAVAAARGAYVETEAAHLAAWQADTAHTTALAALADTPEATVEAAARAAAALEARAAAGVEEWDAAEAAYVTLIGIANAATSSQPAFAELLDDFDAARAAIKEAVDARDAADAEFRAAWRRVITQTSELTRSPPIQQLRSILPPPPP